MTVALNCPTMIPEGRELLRRLVESAAGKASHWSVNAAYHGVRDEVVAERNKGPTEAHHMRCAGAAAIALLGELVAEGKVEVKF